MPDQPLTFEVSYTETVVLRRVVTVPASNETIGESMAMDMVRHEDPKRHVLSARRVTAT